MLENFDLSHRETQSSWPGPLDEAGLLDKIGLRALPASSLSAASAFAFLFTFLFLLRNREIRSLFVLPRTTGLILGILSAALAWTIVLLCRHRPARLWVKAWALALAVLTSTFAILLWFFPAETWTNALTIAGLAGALVLACRLYRLRPDSPLLSRIAPLALVAVLIPVLLAVGWAGSAIAANTRLRVDRVIDDLQRWNTDVQSMPSQEWTGVDWNAAFQSVGQLDEIQPAGQLDLSLWREAYTLGRDEELAKAAGGLLDSTVAGLVEKKRVPRVSRLKEPAVYYDEGDDHWKKSPAFPKASATIGQYFQELSRIFSELDVQDSFPDSQPLRELKSHYLERRESLTKELRSQMESWTDHWAISRVEGCGDLVSTCEVPVGRLLAMPSPIQRKPAADLPGLLSLSYGDSRNLGTPPGPGCRRRLPYHKTREGRDYLFSRIDCYSYSPRPKETGADLRVEMRLVYDSPASRGLTSSDLPDEIYFLFPLPAGANEDEFKKEVMFALSEAAEEVTKLEADPKTQGGSPVNGFFLHGGGTGVNVIKPTYVRWLDGQKGLQVRARRET